MWTFKGKFTNSPKTGSKVRLSRFFITETVFIFEAFLSGIFVRLRGTEWNMCGCEITEALRLNRKTFNDVTAECLQSFQFWNRTIKLTEASHKCLQINRY